LLYHAAVIEEEQRRDGFNAKLLGDLTVLVCVDLTEGDLPRISQRRSSRMEVMMSDDPLQFVLKCTTEGRACWST
jgi:hypothetical protein